MYNISQYKQTKSRKKNKIWIQYNVSGGSKQTNILRTTK